MQRAVEPAGAQRVANVRGKRRGRHRAIDHDGRDIDAGPGKFAREIAGAVLAREVEHAARRRADASS